MKRFVNLSIALLLSVAVLFFLLPGEVKAAEVKASGVCGDNATWTLTDDGKLTISGSGDMYHYWSASDVPWYAYVRDIETIEISSGITGIGRMAFLGTFITEITIPEGVLFIGEHAFASCPGLTSVTLPQSLTGISGWAFYGCFRLTSIVIPKNVTFLGNSVFKGCSRLESITLPDGITTIQWDAFYGCENLSQINIPKNLTEIGDYAFFQCTKLTDLTLPDSFNYIGSYAFAGCSGLTSFYVPEGVTFLGEYAFSGCYNMKSISLPQSLQEIYSYAFAGCSGLTSVELPQGLSSIGGYAFTDCSGMTSVTIPDSLTEIPSRAFYNCASLESVVIPENITTIGERAFELCGMASVSLPSTLTSIGDGAFWNCANLKSVAIPQGITALGNSTFAGCKSLASVTLPDRLTSIGGNTFQYCESLKTIDLPQSLTYLGSLAFYESGLTSVTIPGSVSVIEHSTFIKCVDLTSVILSPGVTAIGEDAFWYCSNLTSVSLPDTLTSIGEYAFNDTGLLSVTIPAGVTEISEGAFVFCRNLTSVSLPDTLSSIGPEAFKNTNLASVTIPANVTHIGEFAFGGCENLVSVSLPSGLTHIGQNAFGCAIQEITIPASVVEMSDGAFAGCLDLRNITFLGSVPSLGSNVFGGSISRLYYPAGNATWTEAAIESLGGTLYAAEIGSNPTGLVTADISWSLSYDNVLTISGTGPIADYQDYGVNDTPFVKMAPLYDTVVISEGITRVGNAAFFNCENIISVSLPGSLKEIGDYAFSLCHNLKDINLPNGLTAIGTYAFERCTGLTTLVLPDSVTSLGYRMIYGCENLESVKLPSNITELPGDMFMDCRKLTTIDLPQSITAIGPSAFSGCTGLTSITLPQGLIDLQGGMFVGCTGLTSVELPKTVCAIGSEAFKDCTNLRSITTSSELKIIGSTAFENCTSLESIEIPYLVHTVGENAFNNCTALKTIRFTGDAPDIDTNAFQNVTATVYYPPKSTWNDWANKDYGGKITWTTYDAPAITQQPMNTIVAYGQKCKVTVEATGKGLTYQWFWADKGSEDYQLTTSFTGNSYSVSMNESRNGRKVYCVITNESGHSVTTNIVSLTGINITQFPKDVSVPSGKKATVTVKVKGEGITYRWFWSDVGDAYYQLTTSFTGNTYSVTMNEARNGRMVYCEITDKDGNCVITDPVTLSCGSPLKITQQPKGVAVGNNKTAKVTVKAEGDGLKYTWYVKDPGKSTFTKSSITKSTYSVKMTKARSGRQVYCVVTDSAGNKVKSDVVTISRITISSQPKGDTAASNKRVSATVKATGDGLKYQWYTRDPGKTKFTKSSVKKATYGYNMTTAKSGREAYCVITDKYGNSVTTDTVVFSRLYIKTQPKDDTAASNKRVSATVKAVGEGLKYQWYTKDPGKTKFTKSSVKKATYGYNMTTAKSGREAYCVITDKYGNSVTTDTVVFSRLYIKTQPKSVSVTSGKTAKVTVKAVGEGLKYTWYVKNPGSDKYVKSSVTKSSYSITMNKSRSGRKVYCVITDKYGNTVKTNTVTLKMK